jgi:Cu+-exporting ATPase
VSDGFSLDDILAEVDSKRSGAPKKAPGVTEILDDKKLREAMTAPPLVSKTTTPSASRPPLQGGELPLAPLPEPKAKPEKPVKAEKPAKAEKPEKKPKEKRVKEEYNTSDIIFKKSRVLPKPVMEDEVEPPPPPPIIPEKPKPNKSARISIGEREEKEEKADLRLEETLRVETIKPKEAREPEPLSEYDEALRKRGEELLERDMSLEQPYEQIDALNPYDILQHHTGEIKTSDEETDSFISKLSGDTNSVADGDLKKLAGETAAKGSSGASTAEVVKTYTPSSDAGNTRVAPGAPKGVKTRKSNTALIESLNKAIKQKRDSDREVYRTLSTNILQGDTSESRITHGLNIDYKNQILSDTAGTASSLSLAKNPQMAQNKLNDLTDKRKRKLRDFVLEDMEDEKEQTYDEKETKDEFDDYDNSGQIWRDLCATHKDLRFRFTLLFIITLFAVLVSLLNDFGVTMSFGEITFMDVRRDPSGFIWMNFLLGFFATVIICPTVITGGLRKLFTGKGDCDSLCAVPVILSVIAAAPHLSGTDFIQRGRTNIFIAVALCGLLFNTAGKLMMMARAKRNFRFISGDNTKYYAEIIEEEQVARAFTKGILHELPILAAMRKTEFLSDFLKNSYCDDKADQLSRYLAPAAFAAAAITFLGAMFIPSGNTELTNNVFWALTVGNAMLCILSPLSIMFLVNNPLLRAAKALSKNDAVVLGYNSAEHFSRVNSVLVDASSLFPAGSVDFRNLKRCQQANSLNRFAIDDAIITAASLAIKSGSVLTSMFFDMLAGKSELLYDIDNCIYEVNMGISGWMGNRRVMLGNREQMKHHDIKIPDLKKEQQYTSKFGDVIYLAVAGETIAMFFIKIIPNEQIKHALQELQKHGIGVVVRTRDSLITAHTLAEAFGLEPEGLRVIPFDLHAKFDDCTKYASRGDGSVACNGTFSSFAGALVAAKKVIHSITFSSSSVFIGLFLSIALALMFVIFARPEVFTTTAILAYNGFFFLVMLAMQGFKRY